MHCYSCNASLAMPVLHFVFIMGMSHFVMLQDENHIFYPWPEVFQPQIISSPFKRELKDINITLEGIFILRNLRWSETIC